MCGEDFIARIGKKRKLRPQAYCADKETVSRDIAEEEGESLIDYS